MAFFWKADAKVRTIFELPKLFRRNFQKSFFQWRFKTLTSFQYFNSSAFLSRKRVQKYCFITYPPNIRNSFLQTFCIRSHNSLILKDAVKHIFTGKYTRQFPLLPYNITRARLLPRDGSDQINGHKPIEARKSTGHYIQHKQTTKNSQIIWFIL